MTEQTEQTEAMLGEQPAVVESTQTEIADPVAPAAAESAVTEKSADAPVAESAAPVAENPPSAPTVDVAALISEAVTKAVDGVSANFATKLEQLQATSTATIAQLQEQITKLSNEPANGGPVANAHASAVVVEKGGVSNPTDLLNDRDVAVRVLSQLEEVAKSETDPAVRQRIVEQSVALRMRHGIDSVAVPIVSQR